MKRLLLSILLTAILSLAAVPSCAGITNDPDTANACIVWMKAAEGYYGIPNGLLLSVATVESGAGNERKPWPWTLNIAGAPYLTTNAAEALRYMQAPDGSIRPNMAVGCMQIYMRYHSQNFRNPYEILDPKINVLYGAWLLRTLYDKYGSWQLAVGHYHASYPDYMRHYICRVLAFRVSLGYQQMTEAGANLCGRK